MNIRFSSFYPSFFLPVLETHFLTVQQKKIAFIASVAFTFLAACYMVK